jgi:hypothetical protein
MKSTLGVEKETIYVRGGTRKCFTNSGSWPLLRGPTLATRPDEERSNLDLSQLQYIRYQLPTVLTNIKLLVPKLLK